MQLNTQSVCGCVISNLLFAVLYFVCSVRGHDVRLVSGYDRVVFGRGQVILKCDNGTLMCGSDGRADGCAFGK